MPDNVETLRIILAGQDQSGPAFQSARGNARALNDEVVKTSEHLGMNRREWMRTGTEATFYLQMIASKSGQMTGELSKGIGVATQLGESLMWGGPVGITMGVTMTLLGGFIEQLQSAQVEAKKLQDELTAPFVAARKELAQIVGVDVLTGMKSTIPATRAEIEAYAKSSKEAADQLFALNDAQNTAVQLLNNQRDAQKELADAKADFDELLKNPIMQRAVGVYDQMQERVTRAKTTLNSLNWAVGNNMSSQNYYNDAIRQGIDALNIQQAAITDLAKKTKEYSVAEDADNYVTKSALKVGEYQNQLYKDRIALIEKLITAEKQVVMGMVEKAITPTTVTAEDQEAAGKGTYKDKWDEFRRRAEDVAEHGVDPAKFGPKFAASLSKAMQTGLSPAQLAADFKDFSLFGKNPELIDDLVDFDAMQADIEKQVDATLGKNGVMDKAFKAAFKHLSETEPSKLFKLGIGSSEELKRAFGLDQGLDITVKEADDFLAKCQAMRQDIVNNVGGSITIDVIWNYIGPSKDKTKNPNDTGQGEAGVAAQITGVGTTFASGGIFDVTRSGWIHVDAGERGWMSGTRNQVPPPSAGPMIGEVHVHNSIDLEVLAARLGRIYQRKAR